MALVENIVEGLSGSKYQKALAGKKLGPGTNPEKFSGSTKDSSSAGIKDADTDLGNMVLSKDGTPDYYDLIVSVARRANDPRVKKEFARKNLEPLFRVHNVPFDEEAFEREYKRFASARFGQEFQKYRDATNHIGEKEYQTYAAWKAACRKENPGVQFEGDIDICQAKPGIGEWDGNKGIIYTKDAEYPEGTRVKVNYGEHQGKSGILLEYAPSGHFAIVKVGGEKAYYHVSDLIFPKSKDAESPFNKSEYNYQLEYLRKAIKGLQEKLSYQRGSEAQKTQRLLDGMLEQEKDVKRLGWKDAAPWYADVSQDNIAEALIELFSKQDAIKDHATFHKLAEGLGMEPSKLEEAAYAMLQSFFSQGRFMKEGQEKSFNEDELMMGDVVELEHTDNPIIARRITLDHLTELPDYYTRLKKMEKEGEASTDSKPVIARWEAKGGKSYLELYDDGSYSGTYGGGNTGKTGEEAIRHLEKGVLYAMKLDYPSLRKVQGDSADPDFDQKKKLYKTAKYKGGYVNIRQYNPDDDSFDITTMAKANLRVPASELTEFVL
jgi:hypothetical protein